MLLTFQVILTIFFSAFALWSQTIDESYEAALPAAVESRLSTGQFTSANLFSAEKRTAENRSFSFANPPARPSQAQTAPSRPKAFTYSNAYWTRQKIHKYASIATLPLFVSEAIVGQKLFDRTVEESDSLRSAHSALAAGIGVLFGVNTVTGVWNLWEARKDPNGRGRRMFHGILMLAADGGFVATAATAPHHGENQQGIRTRGNASTHRAIAFTSLGVATVGYVYMLVTK